MTSKLKSVFLFGSILLVTTLFAYASNTGPTVEELRLSMKTAKVNAAYLAEQWKGHSPGTADWIPFARNDPAQSARCPQGSGWTNVEMIDPTGDLKAVLKCSTVNALLGCEVIRDWLPQKQSGSNQECAALTEVPWPTPALTVR